MSKTAVIIGASHAGAQLCLSLRQQGWTGEIIVIGDEAAYPYQHPPLSKDFLSGEKSLGDILIRPNELYEKNAITFMLQTQVTAINRHNNTLDIIREGKSETLSYDALAICTGARVRELPINGATIPGVFYLRSLADVESIREFLAQNLQQQSSRGVIVGGGYIGLETAAMLRKMGHQITVLEAAPELLGRVAAPQIGGFYQSLHQHHGVSILTNAQVNEIVGTTCVEAVTYNQHETLDADFVIIGIGVLPNQELAEQAGITVNNGIVVNEFAQTSDESIVAAGDCTRFQHPVYGDIRLESVPNATEQAKVAAATLCGKTVPHHGLPWFWSDQYDCKLQIAGMSQGYDDIVLRGSVDINSKETAPNFCVFYFRDDKLIAADCINRPKEFMLTKMWLQKGHTPERGKLLDDNYALTPKD